MLVRDGGGHEGDTEDDDAGDGEQDDAEVKVVDATDDGWTVTGISAAAGSISKLGDHPGQTDGQPDHEAVKCTLEERKEERKQTRGQLFYK